MSYTCDCCGKNHVDMYGKWCSECQTKEHYASMEAEDIWYAKSGLCQMCSNAWGCDPSDKCSAYGMPLYMVARKKKCKRVVPYNE